MSNFIDTFPTVESFREHVLATYPQVQYPTRWTTGGMCGGSCWNDEGANEYVEPEEEPEDETLAEILEDVFLDLTFLEGNRLMKSGIEVRTTGEDREYYGNYTTYAQKKIDIDALYEALVEIEERRG
jgi:hypothetical protein